MTPEPPRKASAYDRYIDYKRFSIAAGAFVVLLLLPIPASMLDVAVEYTHGRSAVVAFYLQELFETTPEDAAQWQKYTAQALEACMRQGAVTRKTVLKRTQSQLRSLGVNGEPAHFTRYREHVESLDEAAFNELMLRARRLRYDELSYARLDPEQRKAVDKAARQIRVCTAMVAFVVICFITEAIPLPGVAF